MNFTDVSHKQVSQFVGIYEDKVLTFAAGRTFRVFVYAAERMGAICPEYNGVAVLRKNEEAEETPGSPSFYLVKSRMAPAASGYYGMSNGQKTLFDELCSASYEEFCRILARHGKPLTQPA